MGQVISLRNPRARPEVVEYFESMLAKARCGKVQGWMGIADMESGNPQGVACGTFVDDPGRAIKAASKGLEVLRSKLGVGKKNAPTPEEEIPERLRIRG
jgi:hypothetical protein